MCRVRAVKKKKKMMMMMVGEVGERIERIGKEVAGTKSKGLVGVGKVGGVRIAGSVEEQRKTKRRKACGNASVGNDKKDSPHPVEGNYVR